MHSDDPQEPAPCSGGATPRKNFEDCKEVVNQMKSRHRSFERPQRVWMQNVFAQVVPNGLLERAELKEIMSLALPAFGAILSDPLMSLIDTACVGQTGSLQLAAMGPITAVFNFVFQMFTFLSIATTGMVAQAQCQGRPRAVKRVLFHALLVAVVCGSLATCLLQVLGEGLLRSMGTEALAAAGMPYLRIRSLAVPFVLVCMVAQGACLGQQDSRTPMAIFMLAGLVNCVLDLYLVLPGGAEMGLAGAATATLVAQCMSAAAFLMVLHRRGQLPSRVIVPRVRDLLPLMNVSGMLLLGSVCRMGVYTLLTVAATMDGVLTVAAHQIALQVFWFLTYFVDPLFVAATSFIARDIEPRPERASRMAVLLLLMALASGVVLGLVSFATPLVGTRLFTSDVEVAAMLRQAGPFMAVGQLLASVVLVAEGILIGVGDVAYLTRMHCLNFMLLIGYLLVVTKLNMGIQGIWMGIVVNQILRLAQHAWRVLAGDTPLPITGVFQRSDKVVAKD